MSGRQVVLTLSPIIVLVAAIAVGMTFGWVAGMITFVICFGALLFFDDGFRRLMDKLFGVDD